MSDLEFTRVFRLDNGGNNFGDVIESSFILMNPNQVQSIQAYLMPLLYQGEEHNKPKTELDFVNGDKVIVRGNIGDIHGCIKNWKKEESMGLNNV